MKNLILIALIALTGCGHKDDNKIELVPKAMKCTCEDCKCEIGKPCKCEGCHCDQCKKGEKNANAGTTDRSGGGCDSGHC